MPLLEVKNLHTFFTTKKGIVKAVNDVSYSLEAGKTIGIVGESGSGKSVSAMSILQLLDGNGYIDMGLDNVFEFDEAGNLLAPSDKTWLSIEGRPVAYYHLDTQWDDDGYIITGRVPCYLNDVRCDLIIAFTSENEDGYIAGARFDYVEGETDTIAKNMTKLEIGDRIDFVCDYYSYDKVYEDSYLLGETLVVDDDMKNLLISNTDMGDNDALMAFCFTDIYGQKYWTSPLTY